MRADLILDYDVVTVQQPQKLYLLARLTAGPSPHVNNRRPLNLSVVIDRSGSMAGDKLNYTRQAAQFLIQNLSPRDRLSVVLYSDRVETLIPPDFVQNKDSILHHVDRITASGTTNLSGGWLAGVNHVLENLDGEHLNRVILMTDGLANRGITDTEQLVTLGKQKFDTGVSTTTMGLGTDFNEDLLIAIANGSGGAFYYIESPEVAPLIFQEELRGLLNIVGQNLTVTLHLSEQVFNVNPLNAYPFTMDGRVLHFRMGDIYGDELKTLALELTLPPLPDLGEQQIATLTFDYDELTAEGSEHRTLSLPVMINVAPTGVLRPAPNDEVRRSVLLLQAAQARSQAVQEADRHNYEGASQVLEQVARSIEAADLDDLQLRDERDALLREAADMARGAESFDAHSRKVMSTQAIYTMTDRHGSTQAMRVREVERMMREHEAGADIPRIEGVPPTYVLWNEQQFPLDSDLIRIGRAQQNEIVIDVNGVSRFHCQIKRQDGQLIIEDLNSTNGTLVGGRVLRQPYVLSAGDEVFICNEKLVFKAD